MSVERNLLVSILKLTSNGVISLECVNKEASLPASTTSMLLHKLQNQNLVYIKGGFVESNTECRLKLAARAIELGADAERISELLSWQEFEAITALALERNGYVVEKNVRFKHEGKRWEIDVVGFRKPLVLCIDCKHWHQGMRPSTLKKMAASQANRTLAFAEFLPNFTFAVPCVKWERAKFVSVILSLIPFDPKYCDGTPIVPVLQMQDFVYQLPLNVDSLKYFTRKFSHL